MTPRLLIIFTIIIGLGLFSYSLTLPYYTDQKAADSLLDDSYNMDKSDYYKKEAALRTSKVCFMDLGSGIAIASATVLLFLTFAKINTFSEFNRLKTLDKKNVFIQMLFG